MENIRVCGIETLNKYNIRYKSTAKIMLYIYNREFQLAQVLQNECISISD